MSNAGSISSQELKDLFISLVALVIAFTVLIGGRTVPGWQLLAIITLGVASGFLLHEMAHKFMAQHFGYWAEYRANMMGLAFAVIASFAGFIFAAPGAVMIRKTELPADFIMQDSFAREEFSREQKKEPLWISLAGPLTNVTLAVVFFLMLIGTSGLSSQAANFALFINLILAGFNFLPFGPLDGKKVFDSNRMVWFAVGLPTIIVALAVYLGIV